MCIKHHLINGGFRMTMLPREIETVSLAAKDDRFEIPSPRGVVQLENVTKEPECQETTSNKDVVSDDWKNKTSQDGTHDSASLANQNGGSLSAATYELLEFPDNQELNTHTEDIQLSRRDSVCAENQSHTFGDEEESYFIQVDASTVVNLKAGTQYTLVPMESSQSAQKEEECICGIHDLTKNRKLGDDLPENMDFGKEQDQGLLESSVQDGSTKDLWMECCTMQENQLSPSESSSSQSATSSGLTNVTHPPIYANLKPVSPHSTQVASGWSSGQGFQPQGMENAPLSSLSSMNTPHPYTRSCGMNCHHDHGDVWSNTPSPWISYDQSSGFSHLNQLSSENEQDMQNEYQKANLSNGQMNGGNMPRVNSYHHSGPFKENIRCYVPYNGRENHNEKERKRRTRIKMSCQNLRYLVPGLTDKTDKATVFEITVQYLSYLKRNVPANIDKEFIERFTTSY